MEVLEALRYVYQNHEIPELKNVDDIKLFNSLKESGVIFECEVTTSNSPADYYSERHKVIEVVWNVDTILAERIYGIHKDNLW